MIIKRTIVPLLFLLPAAVLIIALLGLNGFIIFYRTIPAGEVVRDMDYSGKLRPYSYNIFFSDSTLLRTPPQHVVPMNRDLYLYGQTEFEKASAEYKNPIVKSEFVLRRGENSYKIFCVPCHGSDANGRGLIITKPKLLEDEEGFPEAANLNSMTTQSKSDGHIFHILSAGQNLMFPHADKLSEADRWALVHYIRSLGSQKTK